MSFVLQNTQAATLQSRRTPWDERAFGFGTREITGIHYSNKSALAAELKRLVTHAQAEKVRLLFGRVPADDRDAVLVFQENGFAFVEASYRMSLASLQRFAPKNPRRVKLREATEQDRAAIKEIAATAFHYGRFCEDPKIDPTLNALRQSFWIDDMYAQKKQISVYEADGAVVSFMAYDEKDGTVNLILGGSRAGSGFASYVFWPSLLMDLKEAGHTRIETLISCANTGVLMLYTSMGFTADAMLIGLHRHLD